MQSKAVLRDLHSQVVVGFRLGGDNLVKLVVYPKTGVADIAGYTGEEVERPFVIMSKIVNVAAVPVGVKVSGENKVDSVILE